MADLYFLNNMQVTTPGEKGMFPESYASGNYWRIRLYVSGALPKRVLSDVRLNTIGTVFAISPNAIQTYNGAIQSISNSAEYSYIDFINCSFRSGPRVPFVMSTLLGSADVASSEWTDVAQANFDRSNYADYLAIVLRATLTQNAEPAQDISIRLKGIPESELSATVPKGAEVPVESEDLSQWLEDSLQTYTIQMRTSAGLSGSAEAINLVVQY